MATRLQLASNHGDAQLSMAVQRQPSRPADQRSYTAGTRWVTFLPQGKWNRPRCLEQSHRAISLFFPADPPLASPAELAIHRACSPSPCPPAGPCSEAEWQMPRGQRKDSQVDSMDSRCAVGTVIGGRDEAQKCVWHNRPQGCIVCAPCIGSSARVQASRSAHMLAAICHCLLVRSKAGSAGQWRQGSCS